MIWEVHPDGQQWSLRRTPEGRALEALRWGAISAVATLGFAVVYFGIDWAGRAAVGVDVPPLFGLTVLSFAGLGGFLGFVIRMLRYRHWVIDREARTIALSVRRVFADPQVDEVSFDDIAAVHIAAKRAWIVFNDGAEAELAKAVGKFGFDGIQLGLERAFYDTGIDVVAN